MLATSFIEIENHPVGLVWHEKTGCRFIAASQALSAIDDCIFPSCEAAVEAARAVLAEIRGRRQASYRRVDGLERQGRPAIDEERACASTGFTSRRGPQPRAAS